MITEHQTRVEIVNRAVAIFGNSAKAMLWLNSPIPSLGGQVPMQMIESEVGVDLVLDELGRIEQGVPV